MVFQKWSPVGSQSTDLSSPVVKGVTLAESDARVHFADTIDTLSFRPIGTPILSTRLRVESSIKCRFLSSTFSSEGALKNCGDHLRGCCVLSREFIHPYSLHSTAGFRRTKFLWQSRDERKAEDLTGDHALRECRKPRCSRNNPPAEKIPFPFACSRTESTRVAESDSRRRRGIIKVSHVAYHDHRR